jgi:competence ComEA-like helix-hairpin-helix protein
MLKPRRIVESILDRLVDLVAPAEGEGWLVGLVVVLLLLGAARHRLEPWLQGIEAAPPAVVETTGVAPSAMSETRPRATPHPSGGMSLPELPSPVAEALAPIDPARFGRVDLNRAKAEELESLPRIGPTLAARIIEDRERRGPFASVEELARVRGIGPATVAKLRSEADAHPPGDDP